MITKNYKIELPCKNNCTLQRTFKKKPYRNFQFLGFRKIIDFYVVIPPNEKGGQEKYSIELNFINKKPKLVPFTGKKIPFKISSPFTFFSTTKTSDSKLLCPFTVNLEKGALIAAQYELLESGKFNVISKTYKGGTELVAVNTFELDLS